MLRPGCISGAADVSANQYQGVSYQGNVDVHVSSISAVLFQDLFVVFELMTRSRRERNVCQQTTAFLSLSECFKNKFLPKIVNSLLSGNSSGSPRSGKRTDSLVKVENSHAVPVVAS